MTRKVAIVGSAENWVDAPFSDDSWEIWTLNDMFKLVPRSDVYFELHDPNAVWGTPGEKEWLKANSTIPVYMMFVDEEAVPMVRQYPYEDVIKMYGRYFTNSVSWMVALAIHEEVDVLGIWGVNMAHGTEYSAQKPSCEYFIGLARGKGIEVYIPSSSSLLSSGFLYGLEESRIGEDAKSRITNLRTHLATSQNEKLEAMIKEAKLSGAIEILEYYLVTFGG